MKPHDLIMACMIGLCCVGVFSAVWTQDVPKIQPDKAKYLLAKAEEVQRNRDPNSIEFKIAKQAAARLNEYVRNFRLDVDKNGDVNDVDVNLVIAGKGINGNGIKIEELQ